MAEKKNGGNGNGSGIKMGHVFSEDSSFEALPEKCGIIVVYRNGKIFAYGEMWCIDLPHEKDTLEKNFVGAKMQYGNNVFLVKRENGVIICQKEKTPVSQPKIKSVVPVWKQDRWHNFDQVGEVAARRG